MNPRIQELAELVRYHADLYYNQGKPELSDAEFDALLDEMKKLDPENACLAEIGANPTYGKKVKHATLMGSLDKAKTWAEVQKWYGEVGQGKRLIGAPKIDGLAVKLVYSKGKLVQAATRGDGMEGQDVTANANYMKSIPKDLGNDFSGELRGEVYMKKSVWEKLGEGANPRNAAAGALMQKDAKVTGERNLDFYCYDAIFADPSKKMFGTESAKLAFITSLTGIMAVPFETYGIMAPVLQATLVEWENTKRQRLDYEIDGYVLSIDDLAIQDEAGWSGKCPKGKVAFKFKPEQMPAEIVRVEWFVGRLGKITPVAVITPTRLAGTTVENVTLHNLANVKALDLHLGDKVLVEKCGDVIPGLVRVLEKTKATSPEDVVPDRCPTCKGPVVVDKQGVNLWCENPACPAKRIRQVLHYLESLNILGIGEGIAEKLCQSGMVTKLADLYFLDQTKLVPVLGGARIAEKTYLAVMEKNEIELAAFLDALGIDGLGTTTGKQFAKHFKTLDAVRAATTDEFTALEGIGLATAQKIVEGLALMRLEINELLKAIEVKEVVVRTGALSGMSFCLTGAMSRLRSAIEKDIEAAGGEIKSCGRGLGFLVQADANSTSSKSEKAKRMGVKIISEVELNKMMGK
jgi:DNA ligase (NAD+)